jgi:hypothetical protein
MPGKTKGIHLGKLHTTIHIHPGALHRALGVPQGKKIPEKKLEKAEHSENPETRKKATLAETMKGWKKK